MIGAARIFPVASFCEPWRFQEALADARRFLARSIHNLPRALWNLRHSSPDYLPPLDEVQ